MRGDNIDKLFLERNGVMIRVLPPSEVIRLLGVTKQFLVMRRKRGAYKKDKDYFVFCGKYYYSFDLVID